MRSTAENNTLTLFLQGRIDTNNTAATEAEIFYAVKSRTDQKQLELLSRRCAAFALMRIATTLGIRAERTAKSADGITALLRQQMFTNTDNFCKPLSMPV